MTYDDNTSVANTIPMNIRLPKGLRAELDAVVRARNSTINGEIVQRVRKTIEDEKAHIATVRDIQDSVTRLDGRVTDILAAVTKLLVKLS